jgi:excisionase family DNA binding protein
MRNAERVRELDDVVDQLRQLGTPELAERVRQVADDLRQQEQAPPMDLITTGEAAELLGVRSINTIKRWARDGLLEGYRRGGRMMVSRASIQRLVEAPAVAEQRAFEHDLAAAVAPFEGPDNEPLPTSATWEGRKPWEHQRAAAS